MKSVWSRWFNEPLSPLARVSVTFLLALLGLLIQGVLSSLELKIQEKIENAGVRKIILTHRVPLPRIEQNDLNNLCIQEVLGPNASFSEFRRFNSNAQYKDLTRIPVISYEPDQWLSRSLQLPPSDTDSYLFLLHFDFPEHTNVTVKSPSSGNSTLRAKLSSLPNTLKEHIKLDQFLLIPSTLENNYNQSGYQSIQIIEVNELEELEPTINRLEHLFRLDKRNIQMIDQRNLLQELEQIYDLQAKWRLGVAIMISIVLTLLIGSTALLEFRQNQYVIALLKSFGVRVYLVALAFIFENILLISFGLGVAAIIMNFFSKKAMNALSQSFGTTTLDWSFNFADLQVLALASSIGVILALIPVFKSLQKPVGRVLQ